MYSSRILWTRGWGRTVSPKPYCTCITTTKGFATVEHLQAVEPLVLASLKGACAAEQGSGAQGVGAHSTRLPSPCGTRYTAPSAE